jgi:hypothetical protein
MNDKRVPRWISALAVLALATAANAALSSPLPAAPVRTATTAVAGRPLWPGDVALNTEPGNQGIGGLVGPGIAAVADDAGGTIFVWEDDAFGQIRAQRVDSDGTAQWVAGGVVVAPVPTFQSVPRAVSDGHGGVIVAWIDDRNGLCGPGDFANCNVTVQRLDASGQAQWAAGGVAVSPVDAAHSSSGISNEGTTGIGLGADGLGGAVVAWEDSRAVCCTFWAQRIDAAGSLRWGSEGIQISPDPTIVLGPVTPPPVVVGDGAGGALIGWLDVQVDPLTQVPSEVFQRVSADGQPQFASAIAALEIANEQYSVVDDGAGGAIVAAQVLSQSGDHSTDVQAQRIDLDGSLPWGAHGVPVVVVPDRQQQVQAAPDGAGGALITWLDFRNTPDGFAADIYVQRIDASGTPLWALNGIPVAAGLSGLRLPLVVGDGSGGAIVAWQDCRNLITPLEQYTCDFGRDLYAQHVSATGTPLWPANGIAVTTAAFNQGVDYGSQNVPSVAMVSDGAGGAILGWPDGRATPCPLSVGLPECDVYAQRVSDQFGPPATADIGVTLSVAPTPATSGSPVKFTAVVTNHGPDVAQSVNLTNFIASFSQLVSIDASQGACGLDSLCGLGRLDVGASATVTYVVTAEQAGAVNDTVAVYAAETEPNAANNRATTGVPIAADFTLSVAPASRSVSSGESATYAISASAIGGGGFDGPLVYSCSNLPAHTTCSFINNSANGPNASATLGIATGVRSVALTSAPLVSFGSLLPLALVRRRRGSAAASGALAVLSVVAALTLAACGGGGGTDGGGPIAITPSGTYTVTVTANNQGLSRSTQLTLTVR